MRWLRLLALPALVLPQLAYAADCPDVMAPVLGLEFQSRYASDDPTRSTIDLEAEADVKEALRAVDGFVSDLTSRTDRAIQDNDAAAAACVASALATWARADALSDLATQTVELTIASRLAALALVAAQVLPVAPSGDVALVSDWLARRMDQQMTFWETAPSGAASGNLRAWAALAAASTALVTQDPVTRGWAAWSVSYVACTADADGSLPQEMRRAHLALHYQLHAIAPLAVTAALLERQGVSVLNRCGRALDRIVRFALDDLANQGASSAARAGAVQSLNQGMGALDNFQLAWGEAWLTLRVNPELEAALAERRPLRYSKLGGNQTRIWGGP